MVRSIFCFRRVSFPYVGGALGARGLPIIDDDRTARVSVRRQKLCSDLLSTGPGCIHHFGLDPHGSMSAPLSRGSPSRGSVRTAVRSSRGADLRCRRSGTLAQLPRSPLPDTFVTAPGSARVGLSPSFGVVEVFPIPRDRSDQVPSPIDTPPTGAGAVAVHRERCAKCLCDRLGKGPVTGLPPTLSARPPMDGEPSTRRRSISMASATEDSQTREIGRAHV